MRGAIVVAAAMTGLSVLLGGCDRASSNGAASGASNAATSNERRLTRAKSLELVKWAATFHRCMLSSGAAVGELEKTESHLSMRLPPLVTAADVVPALGACGERLGGPPQKSSLIYRKGRILLYLPKQCLLDQKVAST
jgi:hypothetical protein